MIGAAPSTNNGSDVRAGNYSSYGQLRRTRSDRGCELKAVHHPMAVLRATMGADGTLSDRVGSRQAHTFVGGFRLLHGFTLRALDCVWLDRQQP